MPKEAQFDHKLVKIDKPGDASTRSAGVERRRHRLFCFNLFAHYVEEWFREFIEKRASNFPGSQPLFLDVRRTRDGLAQAVQIDLATTPIGFADRHSLSVEDGGVLLFTMSPDGLVAIFFYPRKTDFRWFSEDALLFKRQLSSQRLTSKWFFFDVVSAFAAYCRVSSLDQIPTITDRISVSWLRFFCATNVDRKYVQSKAVSTSLQVLKWAAVVGLSGSILAVVQAVLNQPTA